MDIKIITIFTVCDDILKVISFRDDPQARMNTAEIMTSGIVAATFFGGNLQQARRFLMLCGYIPKMLSHSRLNRRLLKIPEHLWSAVIYLIKQVSCITKPSDQYIVDSCPLPVCLPCRSWRCKIYRGKEYLGYCAAKKLHYYGLKLHLIVSEIGVIVECILSPASWSDIRALKSMEIDIPAGSNLYADRAYNSQEWETELESDYEIRLIPERKRKSKRQHSGCLQYLQKCHRKVVETVFSSIARYMPRTLSIRSQRGFELRMMLFIIAYSINFTVCSNLALP